MKKLTTITLSVFAGSVLAYNAYSLTCGAQPSCDSLGYTYTGSTSDCVGTALKCPFNSSYFNCVKRSDVFNHIVPDTSKGQTLPLKQTYIVPEDGWVQMGAADHKPGDANKPYWYINGEEVGTIMGESDENSAYYPVMRGDKVMHNGKATFNYFVFYPSRKSNSY